MMAYLPRIVSGKLLAWICLFSGLFLLVFCEESLMTFTKNPEVIQPGVTSSMGMRCALNRSDYDSSSTDIKFITSIVITRHNGQDIATITEHTAARPLADVGTLHVVGGLQEAGLELGFLELQWSDPTTSQSGDYHCELSGVTASGHGVTLSRSLEISLMDVTAMLAELKYQMAAIKLNSEAQLQQLEEKTEFLETKLSNISSLFNNSEASLRLLLDMDVHGIGRRLNLSEKMDKVLERELENIASITNATDVKNRVRDSVVESLTKRLNQCDTDNKETELKLKDLTKQLHNMNDNSNVVHLRQENSTQLMNETIKNNQGKLNHIDNQLHSMAIEQLSLETSMKSQDTHILTMLNASSHNNVETGVLNCDENDKWIKDQITKTVQFSKVHTQPPIVFISVYKYMSSFASASNIGYTVFVSGVTESGFTLNCAKSDPRLHTLNLVVQWLSLRN